MSWFSFLVFFFLVYCTYKDTQKSKIQERKTRLNLKIQYDCTLFKKVYLHFKEFILYKYFP